MVEQIPDSPLAWEVAEQQVATLEAVGVVEQMLNNPWGEAGQTKQQAATLEVGQ